jgi:hypothetical protein
MAELRGSGRIVVGTLEEGYIRNCYRYSPLPPAPTDPKNAVRFGINAYWAPIDKTQDFPLSDILCYTDAFIELERSYRQVESGLTIATKLPDNHGGPGSAANN